VQSAVGLAAQLAAAAVQPVLRPAGAGIVGGGLGVPAFGHGLVLNAPHRIEGRLQGSPVRLMTLGLPRGRKQVGHQAQALGALAQGVQFHL
jgi:hypothetical protein